MPTPIVRQTIGFDEIFNIKDPSPEEVKAPRTENLSNMLEPNWTSSTDNFELGKFNSINQAAEIPLNKLIASMERQNELLMSIMDKIVDLIIRVFKKK